MTLKYILIRLTAPLASVQPMCFTRRSLSMSHSVVAFSLIIGGREAYILFLRAVSMFRFYCQSKLRGLRGRRPIPKNDTT
jgi:hypothetical protein